LNKICKIYETIQKIRKENEKEIKKRIKGRGDQIGLAPDSASAHLGIKPERVSTPSPPATDTGTPPIIPLLSSSLLLLHGVVPGRPISFP
jgi:hypothetical protein